ncbi:MAG TPA: DNA primase DnaG [Halococcus sp.]|nr:DNA primase DnaG [Halococcus sp.]
MEDTDKYLIHADVTAEGVVERNDVVGAIFGQTEGLLGEDLDLRNLQQSSKVGRIDVAINSRNGQSFGRITIASGMDKVETAILAASLETIERIGPCRSTVDVERIEDVRAAKRREVVERAKMLLGAFEETTISSTELIEAVRESARTGEIATYEGLPAGPRVGEGDAIIVVEGRADVLTLLGYGVKNAIAVEGTNVPDAVAALTTERTTTAFLDGDRGGDLILKELAQVGEIDYVAVAPAGKSVEDLTRQEALSALREKVPHELVTEAGNPREAVAATDGSARPAPENTGHTALPSPETMADAATEPVETNTEDATETTDATRPSTTDSASSERASDSETAGESEEPVETERESDESESKAEPETLGAHVRHIVAEETGRARLLDGEFGTLTDVSADETFETIADASTVPTVVVLDGELTQRILDVAAQRGVEQIVARSTGEFVKKPTDVRVRTAAQLDESRDAESG